MPTRRANHQRWLSEGFFLEVGIRPSLSAPQRAFDSSVGIRNAAGNTGKVFFFFFFDGGRMECWPTFCPAANRTKQTDKQTCNSDTKKIIEFGGKEGIKKLIRLRLFDIPSDPRRQRPANCPRGLAISSFHSWYFLLLNSRGKKKKSIRSECMFVLDSGGGLASPCLRKVAGLAGECAG